jgi:N-acetylmuramoyl-L-alanine amidase
MVNRWDPWSALLADRVQREVLARLKTVDRGQKTAHWLVLQDVNCPSVLVESVFLSNDSEGRRAASPEFRQAIAAAIFDGIRNYVAALDELRSSG